MANAEGRLIIYGIAERKGGYPDQVDDGIDPKVGDADTIERIILSNINPRLDGFFIRRGVEVEGQGRICVCNFDFKGQ
jgi:hypothetical protein